MFRSIIALLMLTVALSLSSYSQTREVPKGWKEIKECGVSFLVPKNMNKKRDDATPIDSCYAGYQSSAMTLGFDHDNYMAQPEETSYESLKIDGYQARLIKDPKYLLLYIGGEGNDARFFFDMRVTFKKAEDAQTARTIIESIRFVRK